MNNFAQDDTCNKVVLTFSFFGQEIVICLAEHYKVQEKPLESPSVIRLTIIHYLLIQKIKQTLKERKR